MKKLFIFLCAICFLAGITQMAGATYISETESNDSFATAQNLDGAFSLDLDTDIFWSDSYWHSSVNAINGATSDVDYYSFTVAQSGVTGFFDIDHAWNSSLDYDDPSQVDTTMALFDSSQNVLAVSDDSTTDPGNDSGDDYSLDSFIGVYTFANPGTYYLAVSNYANFPVDFGTEFADLVRPDGVVDDWDNRQYAGDSGPTSMDTVEGYYDSGDYVLHASLSDVPQAVPEPATMLLFAAGLAGLAGFRRRFWKK